MTSNLLTDQVVRFISRISGSLTYAVVEVRKVRGRVYVGPVTATQQGVSAIPDGETGTFYCSERLAITAGQILQVLHQESWLTLRFQNSIKTAAFEGVRYALLPSNIEVEIEETV